MTKCSHENVKIMQSMHANYCVKVVSRIHKVSVKFQCVEHNMS